MAQVTSRAIFVSSEMREHCITDTYARARSRSQAKQVALACSSELDFVPVKEHGLPHFGRVKGRPRSGCLEHWQFTNSCCIQISKQKVGWGTKRRTP
jgi:hypothetical protein